MNRATIYQVWSLLIVLLSADYLLSSKLGLTFDLIATICYTGCFILTADIFDLIDDPASIIKDVVLLLVIHYKIICIVFWGAREGSSSFLAGLIFGAYISYFPSEIYTNYNKVNKMKKMANNMGILGGFFEVNRGNKKKGIKEQKTPDIKSVMSLKNTEQIDTDSEDDDIDAEKTEKIDSDSEGVDAQTSEGVGAQTTNKEVNPSPIINYDSE